MSIIDQQKKAQTLKQQGKTYPQIAAELGVSERTVKRWAKAGGWGGDTVTKETAKVVSLADRSAPPRSRQRGQIDRIEIVEMAIANLSELLRSDHISVNSPGVGSTASALVRLLEYHHKICPPTVSDLARQAMEMGIRPNEFLDALRNEWQQRA